ncbi:DNA-binding protein YbiB [Ramlibacter sp. GCM10027632]
MGSISHYIKDIGRGKDGARAITREQAADLFGQLLDGSVSDLEVGAFCLAMRIKGETADEMAGFLDATASRMQRVPAGERTLVVLPSYNGARKLPVLTPLLALLVAREGLPVLVHGAATEVVQGSRVTAPAVLRALEIAPLHAVRAIAPGEVAFLPTATLCPGLQRLLDVRRVVGLRNSAHSLVKLMNPSEGPAVVVGSYTHPEYAISMAEVFERVGATALLLRGTEGEPVADARRLPKMEGFIRGRRVLLEEGRKGTLTDLPDMPAAIDAAATAAYIRRVMAGNLPLPASIATQVAHIVQLALQA